jgi:hypothetical protein
VVVDAVVRGDQHGRVARAQLDLHPDGAVGRARAVVVGVRARVAATFWLYFRHWSLIVAASLHRALKVARPGSTDATAVVAPTTAASSIIVACCALFCIYRLQDLLICLYI